MAEHLMKADVKPPTAQHHLDLDRQEVEAPTWLFVLPWALSYPGGVNQVVENLYDANRTVLGASSLLLVASWEDRKARVDVVQGRRTVYFQLRQPWEAGVGPRSLTRYTLWLPRAIHSLTALLATESVEVINVHYPNLTALTWTLLPTVMRGRTRLALSFHGMDVAQAARSRGIERWLWRLLLGSASSITVCNSRLRDELLQIQAAAVGKIAVVDNGVDPSKLRCSNASPLAEVPRNFVISLGTFEHKKGHDVTIAAFARLAASHPDLHLVIAGRTDSESTLEALRAQVQRLGCTDRVIFLPNLEHAGAMTLLKQARALVLASRDEPFGIVVLEAGVFGRPVIATSISGVASRLPEDALLRVPPDDPAAIADAVERVVNDAQLADRLGSALNTAVIERFTWDKVLNSYRDPMVSPVNAASAR